MYNVVVIGACCFDGMASSKRVMNIMNPLMEKKLVMVSNLIYKRELKQDLGKSGTLDDIKYRVIGLRSKNILTVFSFVFGGLGFLRKCKQRGQKNIIYSYSGVDVKNLAFILYGKLLGYKIIFDIVEDNRFETSASLINKFRIKSSLFLVKNSHRLANSIIVISDHLMQRMKELTKGRAPIYLIPVTVELKNFVANGHGANNDHLTIFYGGSYGDKDGLEYLLSAFEEVGKKYSQVDLVLTGTGHPANMAKIGSQIEQMTNKDRVIQKGFLSTENYYKLLNDADIFCMTRVNSKFANAGFPFKLGEFLASGKAVIATRVGDIPKYLTNELNSLVISPNSVPELVEALSLLINEPARRKELGVEARKTAEQYFNSEKISMRLMEIFDSMYKKQDENLSKLQAK